jgi:hypothetical protein
MTKLYALISKLFCFPPKKFLASAVVNFICFLVLASAYGQTASIRGSIKETLSGKDIMLAGVQIEGTSIGAFTDSTGNFIISNLRPGIYNIRISCFGYKSKSLSEIEISNSKPAILNIEL